MIDLKIIKRMSKNNPVKDLPASICISLIAIFLSCFSVFIAWKDREDNLKPTIAVSDIFESATDKNFITLLQKSSYGSTTVNKDGVIFNYGISLKFLNASRYAGYVRLDNYQDIQTKYMADATDGGIGFIPYYNPSAKYFVPAGKEVGPIYSISLSKKNREETPISIPISYSIYDINNKFVYKIRQTIVCDNAAPAPVVNLNCRILYSD